MNIKKTIILMLILIISSTAGCSNSENVNEEVSIYSDIYMIVLDSLMTSDKGLNNNMQYIAVNTQTLDYATDNDIVIIMEYLNKYEVNVIDESYKLLEEKGMVKEGNYLEGVLLEVENVKKVSDNKIIVEGFKFKSGKGAVGVKSTVVKRNDKWILENTEGTWIS